MLASAPVSANIPVEDLDRATDFYSEKLELHQLDLPSMDYAATFEAGDGTMLYLYQREGGSEAEHTLATWLVDDLEESVAELRNRGVTFEHYDKPGLRTDEQGIAEAGNVRSAWFKDTEGNTLGVAELRD